MLDPGWAPGSGQLIVAETERPGDFHAAVKMYEKEGGRWAQSMGAMPAVIGKNGASRDKTEGDGKSPIGVFELGEAFGTKPAPPGLLLRYSQVDEHDYWVDDPQSDEYNHWVHYDGDPARRWRSFEKLTHPLYTHAIVVRYNCDPVVKGKGSAIFIHQWENGQSPTAGCVALSYDNLVRLMCAIDPHKRPMLVISATGRISE